MSLSHPFGHEPWNGECPPCICPLFLAVSDIAAFRTAPDCIPNGLKRRVEAGTVGCAVVNQSIASKLQQRLAIEHTRRKERVSIFVILDLGKVRRNTALGNGEACRPRLRRLVVYDARDADDDLEYPKFRPRPVLVGRYPALGGGHVCSTHGVTTKLQMVRGIPSWAYRGSSASDSSRKKGSSSRPRGRGTWRTWTCPSRSTERRTEETLLYFTLSLPLLSSVITHTYL